MPASRARAVLAAAIVSTLASGRALATQRFGPIQIAGNLQNQNLIRHPDASTYEFIQNRNTVHVQLDYDWLQRGKFYSKYDIPFIESSHLLLKYRGAYDSIYDVTPGFIQKEDIHGHAYSGRTLYEFAKLKGNSAGRPGFARRVLTLEGLTHGERDALKFDNQLREFYADVKFRTIPLTVRAGRQQIVWGESDNFRMLDRANSLDTTWHFVQEIPPPAFGWDEIRRPFWMIKFLYDIGNVWKFSQNFLEWYWNPGDWLPVKVAFMPRPWGVPLLDPLNNPVDGGFIGGRCEPSRIKIRSGINAGLGRCLRLMNGTTLFHQGDYDRTPMENSQVGVRYHALTPWGVEFALAYFYQRWSGDDGTDYAPVRGLSDSRKNRQLAVRLIQRGTLPAEYIAPYVHTIGLSTNYSDDTYTQTVYRVETIYDVGVPFFDLTRKTVIGPIPLLPGVRKKNMWKGLVAFDRPTWIRAVNKKSTVFFSGQLFFHYIVNNPDCEPQTLAASRHRNVKSCLVGGFDLPSTQRSGTNSAPDSPAFRDKIRDWESLATFGAFTFYRGGSVVPVVGFAVDLVNQFMMEPFWTVDYVIRDDLSINLAQRYFVNPRGKSPAFDNWGFSSLSRGRSETSVRLTYQF